MSQFGIEVTTSLPMEEAEAKLREALAAEGFGILTEVDVPAVLKSKLGVEVPPYRILGACKPALAHEAMNIWKGFGLIAPCHIAVYDVGDKRVILAFDPTGISAVHDSAPLFALATEARDGIQRALLAVGDAVTGSGR